VTRTVIAQPLLLLLRDARGRFTRLRAAVTTKPTRPRARRRPRPVLVPVQLALF
jgi:hypothetical protein